MRRLMAFLAALVLVFSVSTATAQASPADELPPLTTSDPGPQTSKVGVSIGTLQLYCYHQYLYCWWTITGLPPGITYRSFGGTITGTPTTAGHYTVNGSVKDTQNRTASLTFSWTVNP